MHIIASWRNFKAIVFSFLGFLLTFVDDMFDRNTYTAVLVECHKFHLSLMEQKLEAGLRPNVLTDFHRRMELSTDM